MRRPDDTFVFTPELGQRLLVLRRRAGLTQMELARAMGRRALPRWARLRPVGARADSRDSEGKGAGDFLDWLLDSGDVAGAD